MRKIAVDIALAVTALTLTLTGCASLGESSRAELNASPLRSGTPSSTAPAVANLTASPQASSTSGATPSVAMTYPSASAPPSAPAPSTSAAPSPSGSPWDNGVPPSLPHTTCGHGLMGPNPVLDSATTRSLACFARAVRSCRAASISVTQFGVDTGTDVVATVVPASPCHARYVSDWYTGNFDGFTSTPTVLDCTVSVSRGRIRFVCPGLAAEDAADWPAR